MKTRTAVIIFILAFAVQTTVLRYIAFNHVAPNLLLCLVIVFSFLYDKPFGILLGVIFGFFWDLSFGVYIGVSSIGLLIVALTMILLRKPFNAESLLPAMLGGLLGSVMYSVIYLGVYKLLGAPHSIYYLMKPQPYLIAYNLITVMLMQLVLRRSVIRKKKTEYYGSGYHMISRFQAKGKKWLIETKGN